MVVAVESLLFLLAGIVLAVVLTRVFAKATPPEPLGNPASLRLIRSARTADGREVTRLLVNGRAILTATNDGVRMAEYADEVEQLEAVAARLAEAMGVTVEFERVGGRAANDSGIEVRELPSIDPDEIAADERRRRLDQRREAS